MNTILLVFSFVLFVLAAVPYDPVQRFQLNLVAGGLAFWVATLLFR